MNDRTMNEDEEQRRRSGRRDNNEDSRRVASRARGMFLFFSSKKSSINDHLYSRILIHTPTPAAEAAAPSTLVYTHTNIRLHPPVSLRRFRPTSASLSKLTPVHTNRREGSRCSCVSNPGMFYYRGPNERFPSMGPWGFFFLLLSSN